MHSPLPARPLPAGFYLEAATPPACPACGSEWVALSRDERSVWCRACDAERSLAEQAPSPDAPRSPSP